MEPHAASKEEENIQSQNTWKADYKIIQNTGYMIVEFTFFIMCFMYYFVKAIILTKMAANIHDNNNVKGWLHS